MIHLNAVTNEIKERKLDTISIEQVGDTVSITHGGEETARRTLVAMLGIQRGWYVKRDGLVVLVIDPWTPVLNGKHYCSRGCGANCTKRAYDQAVLLSSDLWDELPDSVRENWEPKVWENMGWHYSIVCGRSNIRKDGDGFYTLYWNMDQGQIVERSDSISTLILHAKQSAAARVIEISNTAKTMFGGL